MTYNPDQWDEGYENPLNILLDEHNPRVPESERSSQDSILKYLVRREGVIPLARKIIEYKGLFHHEKIIALREGDIITVLEGNRRVAACKLLVRPHLLNDDDREKDIPVADNVTIANILSVPVCYAATREIADEVISKIHLDCAKSGWSERRQIRYAADRYGSGRDLDLISKNLGTDSDAILGFISKNRVMNTVFGIRWNKEEENIVWDDHVNWGAFFRAVFSKDIEKHFSRKIVHADGNVNFSLDNAMEILETIARHALVSQQADTTHKLTINSNLPAYFQAAFPISGKDKQSRLDFGEDVLPVEPPEPDVATSDNPPFDASSVPEPNGLANTIPDSEKDDEDRRKPYRYSAEIFFEELQCVRRDDERLMLLVKELRQLSPEFRKFVYAVSFLMRATLECALFYHLKKTGHFDEFKKYNARKKNLGIKEVLLFINSGYGVFDDYQIKEKLRHFVDGGGLDDLNFNSHNHFGNRAPERLVSIAGDVRPILRYICMDNKYSV